MRVLLDECVDERLRRYLSPHECYTCRFVGFKGLTNGELLAAAERAGFAALITVDQNIPYQQSLASRAISIVVLRPRTTNIEDIAALVPDVLVALEALQPGQSMRIGPV